MSKSIANGYIHPNFYADELDHLLTPTESKVLNKAIREIIGWRVNLESRKAKIALSIFVNGKFINDERVCHGCGLNRSTIIKALAALDKYRVLIKEGKATNDGQLFYLEMYEGIDWPGLETRKYKTGKINSSKTEGARKAKNTNLKGGLSDRPGTNEIASGLLDNTTSGLLDNTTSGLLDRPKERHLKDNRNEKEKTTTNAHDPVTTLVLVHEGGKESSSFSFNQMIRLYLKEGFTPRTWYGSGANWIVLEKLVVSGLRNSPTLVLGEAKEHYSELRANYGKYAQRIAEMKECTYKEAVTLLQAEPNTCPHRLHPNITDTTGRCPLCEGNAFFSLNQLIRFYIRQGASVSTWGYFGVSGCTVINGNVERISIDNEDEPDFCKIGRNDRHLEIAAKAIEGSEDEALGLIQAEDNSCPHSLLRKGTDKCVLCGEAMISQESSSFSLNQLISLSAGWEVVKVSEDRVLSLAHLSNSSTEFNINLDDITKIKECTYDEALKLIQAEDGSCPHPMMRYRDGKCVLCDNVIEYSDLYRQPLQATNQSTKQERPTFTQYQAFLFMVNQGWFIKGEREFIVREESPWPLNPKEVQAMVSQGWYFNNTIFKPDESQVISWTLVQSNQSILDLIGSVIHIPEDDIIQQILSFDDAPYPSRKFHPNQIHSFFISLNWKISHQATDVVTVEHPENGVTLDFVTDLSHPSYRVYPEQNKLLKEIARITDLTLKDVNDGVLAQSGSCPHLVTSGSSKCEICQADVFIGEVTVKHVELSEGESANPEDSDVPVPMFTINQVLQFFVGLGWGFADVSASRVTFIRQDGKKRYDLLIRELTLASIQDAELKSISQATNIDNLGELRKRIISCVDECPHLATYESPTGTVCSTCYLAVKPVAPPEDDLPPPSPQAKALAQASPSETVTMRVPEPKPQPLTPAQKLGNQLSEIMNNFTKKAKMDFSLDVAIDKLRNLHISIYKLTDRNLEETGGIFDYILNQLDSTDKANFNYITGIVNNICEAGSLVAHNAKRPKSKLKKPGKRQTQVIEADQPVPDMSTKFNWNMI